MGLGGPENCDLFLYVGEILVAGEERRFVLCGEGGGEAIGVGELMLGFEFGGEAGEFVIGVHKLDGKLGDVGEDFERDAGPFGAPNGIVDFAPVDDADEEFALAINGKLNQFLDLFGAGAIFKEGHERAGVENDALHRSRSRLRSSRRCLRAEGSPLREPRRPRMNSGVSG